MTAGRVPAYGLAAMLGLTLALWCFPWPMLLGCWPRFLPQDLDDPLQHMVGQRYFFNMPWHWPLLRADRLDAPDGTSIAFTDSAPLEAIVLKLVHGIWPVEQGITLYQALSWILQPVACVFALRGLRARSGAVAIAGAIFALSMPTWLIRLWHTALAGHFVLLFALGFYFRATDTAAAPAHRRRGLWWLAAMTPVSLLLHPYLAAMVGLILAACALTRVIGRNADALEGVGAVAAGGAGMVGLGWIFAYFGQGVSGGYGSYSMNALSPFWPAQSFFMPWVTSAQIDATGASAFEGYQYLGAGLIALMVAVFASRAGRAACLAGLRRHAGLVVICIAATLFALSNQAFAGHVRLWGTNWVPPLAGQLRSNGRLFWIPTYSILLGLIAVCPVAWPPAAGTILLACAGLQFVDSIPLRAVDSSSERRMMNAPYPEQIALGRIMDHYTMLMAEPRQECTAWIKPSLMMPLALAAQRGMTTNTMYAARYPATLRCPEARTTSTPLPPDALGITPGFSRPWMVTWRRSGARCGRLGDYMVCGRQNDPLIAALPQYDLPEMPIGQSLPTSQNGQGALWLGPGWATPEGWGAWSLGHNAQLALRPPEGLRHIVLTLRLHAAGPESGIKPVDLIVGGTVVAHWMVPGHDVTFSAPIDLPETPTPIVAVSLRIPDLMQPPGDSRWIGVGLSSIRIDQQ